MIMLVFIIAYVAIGFIAQYITQRDMVKTVATYMTGNDDYTFHATSIETGEIVDFKSSELNPGDQIVEEAVSNQVIDKFDSNWKSHKMNVIISNILWSIFWPAFVPIVMLYYHKYTNDFINDVLLSD